MRIETVLPEQKASIRLNEYTVELIVSEVDKDVKRFNTVYLGVFTITLTTSANNFELIARLKRLYPELTIYRNIEVLQKARKDVILELDLDTLLIQA